MRTLVPRTPVNSVEELLDGVTDRRPLGGGDGKSGAVLERVVLDGRPHVLKQLHPDGDWTMRGFGDLTCRPVGVFTWGLLDAMPECIDHAVVGAAAGLGRNGWGGALLMRDVSAQLIPEGDDLVTLEVHHQLLDHLAELSATFWESPPDELPGLLDLGQRYTGFGPSWLAAEADLGWPEPIPRIAADGWARFDQRAPTDVADAVHELRDDLDPLVTALRNTPQTFLHGDWKMGNLGTDAGRTVLLDWTYPGVGPVGHELGWYLAINAARLPESKEDSIEHLRVALERCGIDTAEWWERQLDLSLLGTFVQFGWEKALGDDDELDWWCERARAGVARL